MATSMNTLKLKGKEERSWYQNFTLIRLMITQVIALKELQFGQIIELSL